MTLFKVETTSNACASLVTFTLALSPRRGAAFEERTPKARIAGRMEEKVGKIMVKVG